MTDDTSYRDKGRAVVLAAMMVLSVVAMSAAFAGAATAAANDAPFDYDEEQDYNDGPTYDVTNFDGTDVWQGQEVTLNNFAGSPSGAEIHTGLAPSGDHNSDNYVTTVKVSNGEATVDTDEEDLDTGAYHVTYSDGPDSQTSVNFWVESEDLSTSFEDDSVPEGEDPILTYESERTDQIVNVTESEAGLDAEEIEQALDVANNNDLESLSDLHDDDDIATIGIKNVQDGEKSITLDADDLETGSYDFEFNHTDSYAVDNASLDVTDEDRDRSVGSVVAERGELANISVDLDGTTSGVLQVGDSEDDGYEAGLLIQDDTDNSEELGEFNVTMNTHRAGAGHLDLQELQDKVGDGTTAQDVADRYPAVVNNGGTLAYDITQGNVWTADNEDVTVTPLYVNVSDTQYISDSNAGSLDESDGAYAKLADNKNVEDLDNGILAGDELASPLGATDFETNIGNFFAVTEDENDLTLDSSDDSSYLTLTERSGVTDINTHTAPADDDMGDLEDFEEANITTTDSVANGDYMLVTLDDFGSTGALAGADNGDDISQGLADSGIYFELDQQGVPSHVDSSTYNTSDDDVGLEFVNAEDYEGDQLILNVTYNTDGTDGPALDLSEDETYDWTVTFSEASPYVDEDEGTDVEGEITLDEREVSLDEVHENIPNSETSIGGDTTVAPGTEVTVRASSSGNFVEDPDTEVTKDRTFSADFDFSDYEAGIEVDLEATEAGGASDSLEAELVDAEEPQPLSYDVTTDPAEPVVGDDVSGTIAIENPNADKSVSNDVVFTFDGDTIVDETVELEGGASDSLEASLLENASAGDYDWELTVDGEVEDSGTLTVEDPDKGDGSDGSDGEDGSDGSDGEDGSDGSDGSDGEDGSDGSDGEDGSDDGTPGFGVGVALVALLGAAMLALRRQN